MSEVEMVGSVLIERVRQAMRAHPARAKELAEKIIEDAENFFNAVNREEIKKALEAPTNESNHRVFEK